MVVLQQLVPLLPLVVQHLSLAVGALQQPPEGGDQLLVAGEGGCCCRPWCRGCELPPADQPACSHCLLLWSVHVLQGSWTALINLPFT